MEIGIKEVNVDETSPLDVFFLGDIHEGSASVDYNALKEAVNIIVENRVKNPNTYVCLLGDLIDAIIPGDPRFDPSEIDEKYTIRDLKDLPRKQAKNLYKYLKPISDMIVSINIGNHEEQYIKRHSNDVYNNVYGELFPNAQMLGLVGILRFKMFATGHLRKNLDIALSHGPGNRAMGMREGYPTNKVHDVFRWFVADFRIMGHIHKLVADRAQYVSVTPKTNELSVINNYFGVSGCFMLKHKIGVRNYFEGSPGTLPGIGMLKGSASIIHPTEENGKRNYKAKMGLQKIWLAS